MFIVVKITEMDKNSLDCWWNMIYCTDKVIMFEQGYEWKRLLRLLYNLNTIQNNLVFY